MTGSRRSRIFMIAGGICVVLLSFWVTLLALRNFVSDSHLSYRVVALDEGAKLLSVPSAGVSAAISGGWCPNGVSSDAPIFPARAHATYGSFCSRGDAEVGTLTFANLPKSERTLAMAILVGPSVDGLSIKVLDAESKTPLISLPLANLSLTNHRWYILVMSLQRGAKWSPLAIEASDEGNGWGQWFAVTTPVLAKDS
jgi:hypothetical protein